MKRTIPGLLICGSFLCAALLLGQANSPAESGEKVPDSPPSVGKGKGKGKGKGLPDPPPPAPNPNPNPNPAPAQATPALAPADPRDAAFFDQKILPVLQAKCFNCHQTGRKTKGGLALDSRAALLAGGDSGPAVELGDAERSLLYIAMTYDDADIQMPPKEQLLVSVLADFKRWIEMGTPYSSSAAVPGMPAPAVTATEDGFMVTITEIRGNALTYTKAEAGGSMGMAKGKGKGKGGFSRGSGGPGVTQRIADTALVTSARLAQRTQDLLVGIELSGGLANPLFETMEPGGVRARIVVKDDRIVELNVIAAQDESDAPIAVKPKRPPLKPGAVRS